MHRLGRARKREAASLPRAARGERRPIANRSVAHGIRISGLAGAGLQIARALSCHAIGTRDGAAVGNQIQLDQLPAMVRQGFPNRPTADAAIGNDRQHRRKTGSPKIPPPDHCADHLTEAALEALNSIRRAGSAIGVSVVPAAKRVGESRASSVGAPDCHSRRTEEVMSAQTRFSSAPQLRLLLNRIINRGISAPPAMVRYCFPHPLVLRPTARRV